MLSLLSFRLIFQWLKQFCYAYSIISSAFLNYFSNNSDDESNFFIITLTKIFSIFLMGVCFLIFSLRIRIYFLEISKFFGIMFFQGLAFYLLRYINTSKFLIFFNFRNLILLSNILGCYYFLRGFLGLIFRLSEFWAFLPFIFINYF